ncbi:outer membrane protein assembly factor BamE domain-containing protein [Blochmannia endosymbiont of Polyrhachis (Hedomyrma) turneri]|uniref:outer membrane protein assembly factor BamE domain-containing protein n=1 Tax=Blochmannia endosymbiont of Polyrhachis (Hedomyrma) turneri TaxID=1505596 RepID=UPI00130E561E
MFLFLINTTNCSIYDNIPHQHTIHHGNYINTTDLIKIHVGMKKQLIFSILGTPILHDPFGSNRYYYISYKTSNYKKTKQNTFTLTFNNHDTLTAIDYETL